MSTSPKCLSKKQKQKTFIFALKQKLKETPFVNVTHLVKTVSTIFQIHQHFAEIYQTNLNNCLKVNKKNKIKITVNLTRYP